MPLPGRLSREERTTLLLTGLHKRIRGRLASWKDIERIVKETSPLVEAAAEQTEVQPIFAQIAVEEGSTPEEAKAHWIQVQEADLLLESGGEADSVSISDAVGVAQWLAGTGRGVGLKVGLPASRRLTQQIDALRLRIAWIDYLQRPDADPHAPGAPRLTGVDFAERPTLLQSVEDLRAQRRAVDARYDPAQAIAAQTRYLLRLYRRFPGEDWLFQAYHGGEAGVTRTLKFYLGKKWPGTAAKAIRTGNHGDRLSFEDVYFTTSPLAHAEAFRYLYGRSDDHRRYWWKIRASQEALAAYRQDPTAFQKEWLGYFPGRPTDAYWYPDAPDSSSFAEIGALQRAWTEKRLLPVLSDSTFRIRPEPLDPTQSALYSGLRPASLGLLRLVEKTYRATGSTLPLTVGDLTLTTPLAIRARELAPPKPLKPPLWPPNVVRVHPPGDGPPPDFDFHTTGIAFDILRPPDDKQRKALEYALDSLEDRRILAYTDAKDHNERRYHVVPNPAHADALSRMASGPLP
ncbi:MAG: hypothetical protein JWL77_4966 [Chthonomonadaceae bacterium]|nr:hypothetical protein [Chthonomonadaceae bacterium]